MSTGMAQSLDLTNRDPNDLNNHVKVTISVSTTKNKTDTTVTTTTTATCSTI